MRESKSSTPSSVTSSVPPTTTASVPDSQIASRSSSGISLAGSSLNKSSQFVKISFTVKSTIFNNLFRDQHSVHADCHLFYRNAVNAQTVYSKHYSPSFLKYTKNCAMNLGLSGIKIEEFPNEYEQGSKHRPAVCCIKQAIPERGDSS